MIVDTSAWIPYFAGESNDEIDLALKEGRVWLSPIVAAELLSAPLSPADRNALIDFLAELPLCRCELDHWSKVGALRGSCAKAGIKISTPDAHVAQCALDLDGYLLTRDKVFSKIGRQSKLKLL